MASSNSQTSVNLKELELFNGLSHDEKEEILQIMRDLIASRNTEERKNTNEKIK